MCVFNRGPFVTCINFPLRSFLYVVFSLVCFLVSVLLLCIWLGNREKQTITNNTVNMAAPRKKTQRKKKDPNAPKRALSAYMFFANENRDIVRAENPGITFGQVGRILGEKWKALTEEEKVPYETKAEADKKRYESEKELYIATKAQSE